jgi:hypothetical protein
MILIKTMVLTYTQEHPAAPPRVIAKALGLQPKQVHNVLYRYKLATSRLDMNKGKP